MTKEEAAEIILRNDPLVWCTSCEGSGSNWYTDEYGELERLQCSLCNGWGQVISFVHAQACRALSIAPPSIKDLCAQEVTPIFEPTK